MGGRLSKPWRDLPWTKTEIQDDVKSYQPQNKSVRHLRILLHGPVGAGKSSFINSVESAILGRICGRAITDGISGGSFTEKYKTFKISKQENNETHCSIVFNDTVGLEQQNSGVSVEDLILALKGHIPEGYEFSPGRPLREKDHGYKTSPSLDDRVHVLVSVVPAASVSLMNDEVVKKMRNVRLEASRLEIPQIAILTKVDEACPEVKKDIMNIYKSKHLKEQVNKFHQLLGIPLNCIFLVKNYNAEDNTSTEMNVQILHPVKQMIIFGNDFLNNQKNPDGAQVE